MSQQGHTSTNIPGIPAAPADPANQPLKVQLPGAQVTLPGGGITGTTLPPALQGYQARFEHWVMTGGLNRLMGENCVFKGTMSATVGGAGGLALGAFLAPFDTMSGLKVAENATARETAVATMRQTGSKAASMGRTFGAIGGVYATTECIIEKYRAKSDLQNSVYAGCASGAFLARSGGGSGMVAGCAGFALWSAAIDSFMRSGGGDGIFGGGNDV